MSTKKRFLKNGIFAAAQKLIRALDQILLVPVFLSAWGVSRYGDWITLMVIPTVLSFADMGFGTAAANEFILKYAANEKKSALDALKCGIIATSIVVVIGVVASILLTLIGERFNFLEGLSVSPEVAAQAISLMILARVFVFYQQIFESYFILARRMDISINLQTINSIFMLLITMTVLNMGGGMLDLAIATFLWAILFGGVYIFSAMYIFPEVSIKDGVVERNSIKKIFYSGIGYLLSPIWQAILFQGTTLAVRITLGPIAVTIFNTVRTVVRAVNQIYTLVITAGLAEMQMAIGVGDIKKARKIFRAQFFIIFLMATVGIIMLLFFGDKLYGAWTKNSLNPPKLMWWYSLAGIFFNSIWWPASFVFQAANMPYKFSIAALVASIVSVGAAFFLAGMYGISGASFGVLLMDIILAAYVFPRACEFIGQKKRDLFHDIILDIKSL